ncbi:MAG: FemAB family XrtA/PEP-CTERM system-associated protein [Sphingosinicella sp.]
MNAPASITSLNVRLADLAEARERERIDAFVRHHPRGSLFHRPHWIEGVERGCRQRGFYLVAERGGELVGGLPLTEIRSRLFGNALVAPGFATSGGILAADAEAGDRLAAAGWALGGRLGCPSLELRGGTLPAGWREQTGLYANFERRLPAVEGDLLATIPKRQRAEVRRALEDGLTVSVGRDARHRAAHRKVYAESVRNLGTPVFPHSLFEAMLDRFGEESDIVIAWKGERPMATMLTFYFKQCVMPYWGGGTAEARRWHANDLVWYETLRLGIARDCHSADFGRSKIGTGPWQRKRIWGFNEKPLVYGVRTENGEAGRHVNPLDPRYRFRVALWQRAPLWLANRVGPLIARGLG